MQSTQLELQLDLDTTEVFDANGERVRFATIDDAIAFLACKTVDTTNVCNKVIAKRE